jgi:uncharacterized alkaline shock family protein YloU
MSEGFKNPLGNIFVSYRAIATVACQSALQSYGVIGLAAKNFAEGITQVLVKDPTLGVDIQFVEDAIKIDLYVILEYGVRITSVSDSVADQVRYQVEKTFGLPVSQVNIHVRGLRVSNVD